METNPGLIRGNVLRDGQRWSDFYVYNRVETIDQKVSELHELVPQSTYRICSWSDEWEFMWNTL